MTGCYVDQFDDDPTDPDTWRDMRLDEADDADHYLNSLLDAADALRKGEA